MSSRSMHAIRPTKLWLVVLLVVFLIAMYAFSASKGPLYVSPYDPDSTKRNGTRGLVELLEHFGSGVSVGSELKGETAIIFFDDLSQDEADRVRSWIHLGGTLVVADPISSLGFDGPALGNALGQPRVLQAECESDLVDGVRAIEPDRFGNYEVFEPTRLSTGCFKGRGGSFMVEQKSGAGRLVFLGSGEIFTNAQLGKSDNSVFAVDLLQPAKGSTITFLKSEDLVGPSSGDKAASSLISSDVWELIWQLVIAGFVLMAWRGRRIGKPVREPQLVQLPGSQLTVAVGNLLQNARQTDSAARILRADLRRTIADLIGVSADTDPQLLASAVSDRTGVDRDRILEAIVDRPISGAGSRGRGLVDLARTIERVHREVANAR